MDALVKVTLNGVSVEISPSLQEDRDTQLQRTLMLEPLNENGNPSHRYDIAYRDVKAAIMPVLQDAARIEAIYRHQDLRHIMCVQLKLGDTEAYATLLSSNIELKPTEGVLVKSRVRKYGEKEMRIRLNFVPRGTKPEEIFSWCVDSGLGEPNRIERCKFEGIEGEAVDIRLVPHPDVDWQMEQMDFDRKATFCGKICDITFNCLDLKAFCKRCKEFGHLPSRCPSKEAEPKPTKDEQTRQLAGKRSSDEISPLQQSNQAKRNRILKATRR